MIKTCLIDMGNVLVHFSHERMCDQIGGVCELTAAEIRRLLLDSGLQWDFERGRYTYEVFHQEVEKAIGRTIDVLKLRHAAADIFWLNDPMPELLDQLKSAGQRLVLFSNTSVAHFEFIRERFDVLDRFDDFILSYEAGGLKPDSPMYEMALDRIGCEPHECFYTDDIERYVVRGREYGFQAEVFTGADEMRTHLARRGVHLPRGNGV